MVVTIPISFLTLNWVSNPYNSTTDRAAESVDLVDCIGV